MILHKILAVEVEGKFRQAQVEFTSAIGASPPHLDLEAVAVARSRRERRARLAPLPGIGVGSGSLLHNNHVAARPPGSEQSDFGSYGSRS